MGRNWFSPEAGGLWCSVVLYPTQSMAEIPLMTRTAGETILRLLDKEFELTARIKEPNDILLDNRKVCGILAEASTCAGSQRVDFVIVGFGLNLKLEFPPELKELATCLSEHVGPPLPPRTTILARLAKVLEESYLI